MTPVVLFDGGCPMCSREIAHYRRVSAAEDIDWIDISAEYDLETRFGISHEQAMARFHVRDVDGQWHDGAAAFVMLWRWLPGYRLLGKAVHATRLTPLLDVPYRAFARWRQRRRCTEGTCQIDPGSKP